jgi:hypothetical protein
MPSVAVCAQAGDAGPDRLELGLAPAPEAQQHRGRIVATRDLLSDRGALRGVEDTVRDARPPFDRTHGLDVDPDLAEPAERHEHQVVAVRDAEPDPRAVKAPCERGLAMDADLDGDRTRRDREQVGEHLAQAESPHGEPAGDGSVLVSLEPLTFRRIVYGERLCDCIPVRRKRRAAYQHFVARNEGGKPL